MEGFSTKRYQTLEKFRWMMVVRIVAAIFVFIIYFFVRKFNVFNFPFIPFAACCFLEGFVNQPYPFITNRFKSLDVLTYIHLILDLILISAIIHFLGGIEFAFFSVGYPVIIVLAGIMLSRAACYAVAFFSSIAYASIVALEFYDVLPTIPLFGFRLDGLHQFGIVAANILFFYFVAFLCGYSNDLIEERAANLEKEKKFSENVIDTMVDGLLVLDESGKIKESNKAIERMTSYKKEKLIGVNAAEKLFNKGSGEKLMNALLEMKRSKEIRGLEVCLASLEGKEIPISVNASYLEMPEEKGLTIVAMLRDVSKEKAMDKMKTEFVSNITHELLTPLTSINGFVTMIMEGKVGQVVEKQREFLEIVKKQTKHLRGMIESMLDFSRMETGRLELYPEELKVSDIIKETISDMEPQVREKELKIAMETYEGEGKVLADRVRLQRVIGNIFGNAIKFTPRGRSIKFDIKEDKGFLRVACQDEGIGLGKENLEKIFERFFQVDSALTRVVGGAGMGLAIAREIVDKHGGRIWAESDGVGSGTRIIFTLPIS